jgi:hypothetical protein
MSAGTGSRLTPLELVTCVLPGIEPGVPPLRSAENVPARAVLEQIVTEAFTRPPVVVSFSGGRDSSAILAVAALVARRLGVAPPLPVTLRFRGLAETDEAIWQELLVQHLGLPEWVRLDVWDDLDALGPYASRILSRHGLLWPPNTHFHVPIFETARGGTVLTGIGGDEMLAPNRWLHVAQVLDRRVRPHVRDVLRIGYAVAPQAVRRGILRRRETAAAPFGWLRPDAERALRSQVIAQMAGEPPRWDCWVRRCWWPSRYRLIGQASLATVANAAGTHVIHPLQDARFLATAATQFGRVGFETRTEAMSLLFGDLLPRVLQARATKASFDAVFFNRHSRTFVADWNGTGVDEELVDPDALRREWAEPQPTPHTLTLLQSLWLASQSGRDDIEKPVHRSFDALP